MPDDTQEAKIDQIIDAIFDALPATTREEIARKVNRSRRWRNSVSIGTIDGGLARVRANSGEYGWTVPHVKRGIALDNDEGRFIALKVDREGRYLLDQEPMAAAHIAKGMTSMIAQTTTQMQNLTAAARIAATHTRSTNARGRLNDLADDFAYIARKAAAVARDLDAA